MSFDSCPPCVGGEYQRVYECMAVLRYSNHNRVAFLLPMTHPKEMRPGFGASGNGEVVPTVEEGGDGSTDVRRGTLASVSRTAKYVHVWHLSVSSFFVLQSMHIFGLLIRPSSMPY